MLKYIMNNGEVDCEQTIARPTLYLDQWMWGHLSENNDLRSRFIELGKKISPTIMYSFVTFLELALITDQNQVDSIKEVMDNFDYGFLVADATIVIQREEELEKIGGGTCRDINICCDTELIKNYVCNAMNPLKPHMISQILVQMRKEGEPIYRNIGQSIDSVLTPTILKARKDPEALENAKKRHCKKELKRKSNPYTKDIQRIVTDFLVVNKTMKMTSKEWRDVFNLIVPVAYCDFVLLDKRWCHFIRDEFPLSYPNIAQVFSQKDLEKFLTALSDFRANKG